MPPSHSTAAPISFVVTLDPSATEVEASVVRSGIRAFASVAAVVPVTDTPALTAASEQARVALRDGMAPVLNGLVADINHRLDEMRSEVEARTGDLDLRVAEPSTPVLGTPSGPRAVPAQRNTSPGRTVPPRALGR